MSEQPYLRIENISKSYPGVQALSEVTFDIQKGQLHALVGENGAGKSTLIKILAGAEQADSGTIIWHNAPYNPANPHEALKMGVATIYQVFNLLPDRTIMHNILLNKEPGSKAGWIDYKQMRTSTQSILDRLGAGDLNPDMQVKDLRVGQQQIVEIAKALMNNVDFLIMDEPTAALNQAETDALFKNIQILRENGVTILYVSHHLDEIFQLADTVTVLRDGRHISTRNINEVTESSLIFEMIGRKVTAMDLKHESNPSSEEILKVDHITSGKMLQDISFSLHKGEILAIAGLSGSGKTELGKAIYGDIPIKSGNIWINGKHITPTPEKAIQQGMIYLPEDRKNDGVLQQVNIRRNVTLSALPKLCNWLGVIDQKREKQIANEQISRLQVKTRSIENEVGTLSGGNQQKVALARCLAVDPKIYILMEPTQGIDIGVKFEIYQFILDQAKHGCAILLISSELTEIMGLAHRILVMHEGEIAATLTTSETSKEEIMAYALGIESVPAA